MVKPESDAHEFYGTLDRDIIYVIRLLTREVAANDLREVEFSNTGRNSFTIKVKR